MNIWKTLFYSAAVYGIFELISSKMKSDRLKDMENELANAEVKAFLMVIRYAEGTDRPEDYRTMFGGTYANPRRFEAPPWNHPDIANTAGVYTSTAAGAYQFLHSTWELVQRDLDLPDFSPHSQDVAAVYRLHQRKVLDHVKAGNFTRAIYGDPDVSGTGANKEWASLPGSPYGQPTKSFAELEAVFEQNGGILA